MKKTITIWFFMIGSFFCYSQDCGDLTTENLNGEIYDFQLEDCTGRVFINTQNYNTILHGITLVGARAAVNLRASGVNSINIKPDDPLDIINLVATDASISLEDFLRGKDLRTRDGSQETEEKTLVERSVIYPNPVDSIVVINVEETIYYYKIVTDYSLTVREGTMPTSKQLNLSTLAEGVYYLLMETENAILVERFYKN